MKKLITLGLVLVVVCSLIVGCGDDKKQAAKPDKKVEQKVEREYTNLQKAFFEINKEMKAKDIETIASKYKLPYSKVEYSGSYTYQLALTKEDTAQKYNRSHEDYLEVSFNKRANSMQYTIYTCKSTSKSAMLYVYGYYFDLGEKKPDNTLVGYYCDDRMKKEGIEINGKKSSYIPMPNAREALDKAIVR